ncbi:hypothetical protein FOZ61_008020 [Perkinsus olseni]|uniref:Peptidase A1 domain-containing protein n=1 Tax=Perkinsus olseni TaxID=32597 RepID=A0A7J6M9A2_PEROL|nr:hypothetical protein FOZ61_008020 [Perkinsus olseni]
MASFHSTLFCFLSVFAGASSYKLVRLGISRLYVESPPGWRKLVAKLEVDNEEVYALVDTGSPLLFFLWRHSPKPCQAGPTKTFSFHDDTDVTVFRHHGTLSLGILSVRDIDFGLVTRSTGVPWASLGLGVQTGKYHPYTSLINQMLAKPKSQRLIESTSFSLYLTPDGMRGELLLGGQDPSKYDGPLQYIRVVDREEHEIRVRGLMIGSHRTRVTAVSYLDTGTDALTFPTSLKQSVLYLLQTAGQTLVPIFEHSGTFRIACNNMAYLPTMTIFLEGLQGEDIALRLPPRSFVDFDGGCFLLIQFEDKTEEWTLGNPTVIGHYHFYEWDKSRIGLAAVR